MERGDNVGGGVLKDVCLYGEEINIKNAQGKRIGVQRNKEFIIMIPRCDVSKRFYRHPSGVDFKCELWSKIRPVC